MKVAIVDSNNSAFKVYQQFKESRGGLLRNSFGIPTTVIFGLLRTFNSLTTKMSFDKIILCWDVTGSKYRKGIFPLYKSHRKYIDMKDYFEELDTARLYLKRMGFTQLIVRGVEADDVIGFAANKLANDGHKVIIISDDKDFYQLITNDIKIYRPIKEQIKNLSDIIDEFGMNPKQLPKIKAITGEDTDFIPGVTDINEKEKKLIKCGLGEKNAIKILDYGKKTLKEAIETCELEKWQELLKKKRKQIFVSYKLARIRTKLEQYLDWEVPLMEKVCKKIYKEKEVKSRKILRLVNDLEIKSFNIINVLSRLGIKLDKGVGILGKISQIKV